MIERCLGHAAAARAWFRRALALNPHFSLLWAPVAKEVRAMKKLARRPRASHRRASRSPRARTRTRSATSRSTATAAIEPSGNRLYVLYVLDLAEIPTFQAKPRGRRRRARRAYATGSPASIGRHLELDGRRPPVDAHADPARARLPAGPGGPAHDPPRGRLPRPRSSRGRARLAYRDAQLRRPDRLEGDHRPAGGGRARRLARARPRVDQLTSSSPTRRTSCRARSTSTRRRAGVDARHRRRRAARRSSRAACSSSASACGRSPTAASRA